MKTDIADHPGKKISIAHDRLIRIVFFWWFVQPLVPLCVLCCNSKPLASHSGRSPKETWPFVFGMHYLAFNTVLPSHRPRLTSVGSLSKSNWDLKSGVSFISQFHPLRIASVFFPNFSYFTSSFIFHWFPPSSCLAVRLFISIHFFLQFLQNQISWWRGV